VGWGWRQRRRLSACTLPQSPPRSSVWTSSSSDTPVVYVCLALVTSLHAVLRLCSIRVAMLRVLCVLCPPGRQQPGHQRAECPRHTPWLGLRLVHGTRHVGDQCHFGPGPKCRQGHAWRVPLGGFCHRRSRQDQSGGRWRAGGSHRGTRGGGCGSSRGGGGRAAVAAAAAAAAAAAGSATGQATRRGQRQAPDGWVRVGACDGGGAGAVQRLVCKQAGGGVLPAVPGEPLCVRPPAEAAAAAAAGAVPRGFHRSSGLGPVVGQGRWRLSRRPERWRARQPSMAVLQRHSCRRRRCGRCGGGGSRCSSGVCWGICGLQPGSCAGGGARGEVPASSSRRLWRQPAPPAAADAGSSSRAGPTRSWMVWEPGLCPGTPQAGFRHLAESHHGCHHQTADRASCWQQGVRWRRRWPQQQPRGGHQRAAAAGSARPWEWSYSRRGRGAGPWPALGVD
jgi:hypothetical protein